MKAPGASNRERLQQIEAIYHEALELDPATRESFLARTCSGDAGLRRDVESLLAREPHARDFIESPALEVAARLVENHEGESLVGRDIGHYRVISLLGAGGMGEVYLAEDERLGRKLALKLLPQEFTRDLERVNRFEREARAASALNHPNILTIYEIGQAGGTHFIATEFIEGRTLRQHLSEDRTTLDQAIDIACQIASALVAAHKADIVHRDIKPENIMLRRDGYVKLLDFGLAKLVGVAPGPSQTNTEAGVVLGTVKYMSPEQTRGLPVDARTDIFSLAVVLYEMLAGRVPFSGATTADVIASILEKQPAPPLARFTSGLPDPLERAVARALSKDLNDRYQTAEELLSDLRNLKRRMEFEQELKRTLNSDGRGTTAMIARTPETRYAKSGDVNIAYQVVGSGPIDLVYVMGWVSNLDYFWEEPAYARFLGRLASFSRLILFDKRGTGLSDRVHESDLPTLEQRMDDVRAVMDAIGCERAALVGVSEGGPMSALFAATYPERTSALIMYGSYAKRIWDPDYPWAPTPEKRQQFFDIIEREWGGVVDAATMAPSKANNESFKEWWAAYLRRSASPGAALALARMNTQVDIRHILPAIRVPTLVIHRTGDLDADVGGGRYIARHIPGARFVEFPGDDHLPWVGDQDSLLSEIEGFLTSIERALEVDRVLATILIAHIGGPAGKTGERPDVLRRFQENVRTNLTRFRGREVEITEDKLLATFDGPARAIRAACAIGDEARRRGIDARAGVHTGECDIVGDRLSGAAVEIGARVAATATAGDVLVSNTVKDLVAGSGIKFEDRGIHGFESIPGQWRLFAVQRGGILDLIPQDTRAATVLISRRELAGAEEKVAGRPKDSGKRVSKIASGASRRTSKKAIRSIAVLPFLNNGSDPNLDYLSDGVTEAIINTLSQLPKLRVVARSSVFRYKDRQTDPREVGRLLNAQAVLTGRVRQVGDRFIVSIELVDVENDSHLWGENYNRKLADIFEVQEEIAGEITEKLRLKLTRKQKSGLARRQTVNVEAYQAYLKGRYHWNKRTPESLNKGIEYFRQAIDLDPGYAAAYAGLSDSYTLLVVREAIPPAEGFAKAKASAMQALQIDEGFSEAHASLGHAMLHNWEWEDAEKELKRALELNPRYPSAHHWYSEHLTALGRSDESIRELKLAGELDPLSLVISADLGRAYYYARRYGEVMKQEARTLEMDQNFWLSHINIGRAHTQKGMHQEAIAALERARKLSPGSTEVLSFLGFAYAAAGEKTKAVDIFCELTAQSERGYVPPYHLAIVQAGLGAADEAFKWLERAFENHSVDLFTLKVEPMFDSLHSDPRFDDLLRRMALPPFNRRTEREPLKTIAVLPLKPINAAQRDEYLELGMADALITRLSDISEIVVRPTSSVRKYTDLEQDSVTAGRELKVESVLEGCILRLADRIRVTARLVNVEDGRSLWTGKFDESFTDIFEVEDLISERVVAALKLKLSLEEKDRLTKRYTENTAAYHLYLKGRYFWNKRTEEAMGTSIECFKQAIEIDANYALAYGGLADAYTYLGDVRIAAVPPREAFSKGKAAALKALDIDEKLAEAHVSLAHISMHQFEWSDAEKAFKRALELKPNYPTAHDLYSYYLIFNGRVDEALLESQQALELDPLSQPINADLGEILYFARRYDQAMEQFRKTLEMDPQFDLHLLLARIYEQMQAYQQCISELKRAVALFARDTDALASLAHAYILAGERAEGLDLLAKLNELSRQQYVSPFSLAVVHTALGEKDQALELLEQGFDERAAWMIYVTVDPRLEPLHSHPRFGELVSRIGLAIR